LERLFALRGFTHVALKSMLPALILPDAKVDEDHT
jgi:hypothetical protein